MSTIIKSRENSDNIVFSKMGLITVSVIIPVFNGLEYTKKCLENLSNLKETIKCRENVLEIILVDDGSTDGTYQWVEKRYPEVHLLRGNGNLWWSGGINTGTDYALNELNTDYILWWNNDIICQPDYFDQLFSILNSNKSGSLVGSKIYRLHENLIWGMGGRFDPKKGVKYMHGDKQPDSEQYMKPLDVDWFPGMGTTIHRSVFEKIGKLDTQNFPQYHGDSDFTFRAKKAGFNLIAYPQLVLYNDVSNTGLIHNNSFYNLYKSLTSIKSNYNIKKNILFLNKHATSSFAYLPMAKKYFLYIGGFIKWKILSAFGVKK
jgi:GT2 family glycosyltransferase